MIKLISIDGLTRPAEINTSIVKVLADALDQAKSGKVTAVAIAAINDDGSVSCVSSETDCIHTMLDAVEQLQLGLMNNSAK